MELIAKEGMWLTQAALQDEAERGFWKRAHLAYSLSETDFTEWTDKQKVEWEAEHPQEEVE